MSTNTTQNPAAAAAAACDRNPNECYTECGNKVISTLKRLQPQLSSPSEAVFAFAHCCLLGLGFVPYCSRLNAMLDANVIPKWHSAGKGFEQQYRFMGKGFGERFTQEEGQPLPALGASKPQLQIQNQQGESDYKADAGVAADSGAMSEAYAGANGAFAGADGAMQVRDAQGNIVPVDRHRVQQHEAQVTVTLRGIEDANGAVTIQMVSDVGAARASQQQQRSRDGASFSSSYSFSSSSSQEGARSDTFQFSEWIHPECTAIGKGGACDFDKIYANPSGMCQRMNERLFSNVVPDKPPQATAATHLFRSFFGPLAVPRLGFF